MDGQHVTQGLSHATWKQNTLHVQVDPKERIKKTACINCSKMDQNRKQNPVDFTRATTYSPKLTGIKFNKDL